MAAHQNNLWESCSLVIGELNVTRELLLAGADPNTRGGRNNSTCLMEAVRRNHQAVVNLLLAQPSIEVNAKDNSNRTALHYACHRGSSNIAILSKLLAVPGILVNERDSYGWTPIMDALTAITYGKAVRVMAAVEHVDLDVNGRSLEDFVRGRAKYDQC